jgi:hypothetical protein
MIQACDEPGFATAYSKMCFELATKLRVADEDGVEVSFRKALLTKCQREFEAEKTYDDNREIALVEIEKAETVRLFAFPLTHFPNDPLTRNCFLFFVSL